MEEVILVDIADNPIGQMEKMEAHEKGLLHRAFSIFILNSEGELLLQRRALHKYHSGGLWTNTCCSHPRKGETVIKAANRRLQEEMGMKADMKQMFSFIYKAKLDQNLIEHELDHVLIGKSDTVPNINEDEVAEWQYKSLRTIEDEIRSKPELYTEWFKIIFQRFMNESLNF